MCEKLPKIELHCHLDGSLRPETIIDIAKKENIQLPSYDVNEIRNAVIAPLDCKSLDEYLKRFSIPNLVMQSKENLKRITFELFEDAAKENVKYMEVRFAPLLHKAKGLELEEIIESVLEGIKAAEEKYEIKGNLILGSMKNMGVDAVFDIVEKGKKYLNKGVVAIDLCGSELEGFSKDFIEPIKLAKEYGYKITIHAGEAGVGKNVLEAIELLKADRIGHGVYIRDCKEAYDMVKNKGVILEMCPTSNVQTKAVNSYEEHPLGDYFRDGIKVCINTDNRTVSDTNMNKECNISFNKFKINEEDYKKIYLDTVEATFADENTKQWLKEFI